VAVYWARVKPATLQSPVRHAIDTHRVPKLVAPLFQIGLIQFVVHGFQQNIVHCKISLLTVTPIMTYALYRVCSV